MKSMSILAFILLLIPHIGVAAEAPPKRSDIEADDLGESSKRQKTIEDAEARRQQRLKDWEDAQANTVPSLQSIAQAMKEKKSELIKNLLQKVVNFNEVDSLGNSLLHYSVMYNAPEVAQFLVDKGVSLELKNSKGKTALALAVDSSKVKLVRILCKRYREDAVNPSKGKPVVVQEPKEQPKQEPKPVEVPSEKKQKPSLLEQIREGKRLKQTETIVKEPAKPKMPESWKRWTSLPLKDLQSEDSRLRQESMKAGLAKDNARLVEISEELAYLAGLIADRKAQAGSSDDDEDEDEDWD